MYFFCDNFFSVNIFLYFFCDNEFTFDVMYKKAKRESQNILKEDLDLPSLKLLLQDPMSGDNDDEEEEEEEEE